MENSSGTCQKIVRNPQKIRPKASTNSSEALQQLVRTPNLVTSWRQRTPNNKVCWIFQFWGQPFFSCISLSNMCVYCYISWFWKKMENGVAMARMRDCTFEMPMARGLENSFFQVLGQPFFSCISLFNMYVYCNFSSFCKKTWKIGLPWIGWGIADLKCQWPVDERIRFFSCLGSHFSFASTHSIFTWMVTFCHFAKKWQIGLP